MRRRALLAGAIATLAAPRAFAQETLRDGAGRSVPIPAKVTRVFPAGPPAAILLYTLAPDLLIGWPTRPGPEAREFLLPEIAARPEIGRITGRGNTANLEIVLELKPDLILDVGSTRGTFASLADRVQSQTGIPYALLDGRLDQGAETYRTLGRLIGRPDQGEKLAVAVTAVLDGVRQRVARVPAEKRPRVYYARGPRGLETGRANSINMESLSLLGAINVAGGDGGGLTNVSIEQILTWNPDVIVTVDRDFAANVRADPAWAAVKAVREGRVHLAPMLPFGWIDFPPAVNRLVGLPWLGSILYPDAFPADVTAWVKDFYLSHYHVDVSDAAIARLLKGPV